jgi:cytochrome b6-f complex iron-sulfur subunit
VIIETLLLRDDVVFHSTTDTPSFWLTHTRDGRLFAFDAHCTYRRCIIKWVYANHRFECPCPGSKYTIDGVVIEGPAPRNLDYYPIEKFDDGTIRVDTRYLLWGAARA